MNIIIKEMTEDHYNGKGYVHYTSWNETYHGLIDDEGLKSRSVEKCIELARKYPQNTLVALDGNKVVGFACYAESSRTNPEASEIIALYVLKEYQRKGVGSDLFNGCLCRLPDRDIMLFVLKGNDNAINFYEHIGFTLTGFEKKEKIFNIEVTVLEMIYKRP